LQHRRFRPDRRALNGIVLPTPEALLETLVRFAALAGLVVSIGAVAVREFVFTRVSAPTWPAALERLTQRAAVVGMVAGAVAVAAVLGKLWVQLGEVRAPGTPVTMELVQLLVWRTTWGRSEEHTSELQSR